MYEIQRQECISGPMDYKKQQQKNIHLKRMPEPLLCYSPTANMSLIKTSMNTKNFLLQISLSPLSFVVSLFLSFLLMYSVRSPCFFTWGQKACPFTWALHALSVKLSICKATNSNPYTSQDVGPPTSKM